MSETVVIVNMQTWRARLALAEPGNLIRLGKDEYLFRFEHSDTRGIERS